MPECRDCGSKDVAYRIGKNGKPYLIDTKRPHFCPKRAKGSGPATAAKVARQPGDSDSYRDAKLGLMALRYKPTEAEELLQDIPEGAPEDMVLAALKKQGADAAS